MNCSVERLEQKLQTELGRDFVTVGSDALAAHVIDGDVPALVCSPSGSEQAAAALRICADAKAAVAPWGGGTAVSIGNIPRTTCVVMDLNGLNRVIDHDHANLTITVEGGTALRVVQDVLSRRQQFVPIDAPWPARATIGGTVAVDINGPRRGYYGGVRDLLIGMKAALVTGEHIRAGGKVVKNVAGYDMCKLFTGSLGTLGVITELTVRVAPIPETTASLVASGRFGDVNEFIGRLSRSPLIASALTLMNGPGGDGPDHGDKSWQVALWCDGFDETVTRELSDAQNMTRQLTLRTKILRGADHDAFWEKIRDFPLDTGRCIVRATVPRAAVRRFIETVNLTMDRFPSIVADMAIGTVWLSWSASETTAAVWPSLISPVAAHGGHAVLFSAPRQLKEGIDVWGPPPAALPLMRGLKEKFDPDGLLNPGRFIGGI